MRNAFKALIPAAGLTLLLAGCGGSTPAATPSDTASATPTAATSTSASFGNPATLSNGVVVTVTAPTKFTPSKFASNYFAGQEANALEITIKNASKAEVDLSSLIVEAATSGNSCVDILDGDAGINGAPTDPLAVNASVSFKYGIGCDGKAGDPLDITISLDPASTSISGKLA